LLGDRAPVERATMKLDESLHRLLECLRRPVLILDKDFMVVAANQAFYATFGTRADETLGFPVNELSDETWDRQALVDKLHKVFTDDTGLDAFEIRHTGDAGLRIASVTAHRLELPDSPDPLLLLDITDTTELRRAHEFMAHGAAVLDSTYDAIIGVDPNGKVTSWNEGAERMYGYTSDEAVGRSLRIIVPDDRRNEMKQILRQLREGKGVEQLETYRVHKDGTPIYVWLTVSPICDERHRVIGASSIERDISERKEKEAEIQRVNEMLRMLNAKLAETNEEVKAFSYSVSHGLRAPLRAITGFSRALKEEYADRLDDTARDYLQRIQFNAQRMNALIDDVLKLTRLSQTPLSVATIDLTRLVRRLIDNIRSEASERTVDWQVQEGLTVRGDPNLIEVVLENLLRNAWKYTAYEEHARIEVGSAERNGRREIFVRDNGIGFEIERIQTMFAPFRRLHTAQFPGTGIGLALVKRVIDRHNGYIRAESEEGKGATFYFVFDNH
jgi:PAS domain S-box-containing protein